CARDYGNYEFAYW
nr:immunoglobulin heavy chain junction region [Mus musculus]